MILPSHNLQSSSKNFSDTSKSLFHCKITSLKERSFMFKNCNSDSSSIHSLYSAKNLKWSIKNDVHKIRRRFLHVTEILRSLLYKFTPIVDNHEFSSCDEHNSDRYYVHEIAEDIRETQQVNEPFSLRRFNLSHHFANSDVVDKVFPYENDSSSTPVNMSFTLPNLRRSEVDTCTKPRWISSKENWQQCKRGSKWKDQPSAVCHLGSTESPVTPLQTLSQKLVRDPAFSTYLRKLLVNPNILTCKHARRVQQKKSQLHCGEKDRGCHKNEGKSLVIKAISESKDLQNVIHERFSFLEKQYRGVEKITHLVHAESSVISEEWTSLHIMNWEIHMEIGDSIMDDIVKEIIDLF